MGLNLENDFHCMTWQNFAIQQEKDQKRQLYNATKPCSFEVIHHFVENDVITYMYDVIGHLNGR